MEIWKDIAGYEGKYQISNLGNVRSLNYRNKGIIKNLKLGDSNGYSIVGLRKNGKYTSYLVHRLVGISFVPNDNNLPEIDHKDRNKKNNCVDNLRWATKKENAENRPDSCLPKQRKAVIVRNIITKEIYTFVSINEACRVLSLHSGHVSEACKGINGSHSYKGYEWFYNNINKSQTIIESTVLTGSK